MADKEEIKTLEELEEKGRILREYKEKFRQMCQENKMIKGSTVLKLYERAKPPLKRARLNKLFRRLNNFSPTTPKISKAEATKT